MTTTIKTLSTTGGVAALAAALATTLTTQLVETEHVLPEPAPAPSVALPWHMYDPGAGEDLAAFVERIQHEVCVHPTRVRRGCWIMVPPGDHETSTIHLRKNMRLTGGGAGRDCNTVIRTGTTTGIRVWKQGQNSVIEGLCFRGDVPLWSETSSTTWQPIAAAGIHAEGRVTLRDLHIARYTTGIRISADVNRVEGTTAEGWPVDENTNSNTWRMFNVWSESNSWKGIFVDGGDTNAGVAVGVDSASNCRDADKIMEAGWQGPCYNLDESSFLGNTWVGLHSSFAVDRRSNPHRQYGSTGNPSSRNVFVGLYAENEAGNGTNHSSGNDLILGGLSTWEGVGMVIGNGYANTLCIRDPRSDRNPLRQEICFGGALNGSGIMAFDSDVHAPFRWKAAEGPDGPFWRTDFSNLNARQAINVLETGEVRLPNTDLGVDPDPVDLSPYALRSELGAYLRIEDAPTAEDWTSIPRCPDVAPWIVRTSTHGHVTAYDDGQGSVRSCYFEGEP